MSDRLFRYMIISESQTVSCTSSHVQYMYNPYPLFYSISTGNTKEIWSNHPVPDFVSLNICSTVSTQVSGRMLFRKTFHWLLLDERTFFLSQVTSCIKCSQLPAGWCQCFDSTGPLRLKGEPVETCLSRDAIIQQSHPWMLIPLHWKVFLGRMGNVIWTKSTIHLL